jgi:two-component system alkaline phosphatase synthesis response regulator PhoP
MEGKKTVLIVEDDNFLRGLSAGKLSDEGYEVLTASNGEEAIKIAGESKPMMILLDLLLPNVDGFTALEAIRKIEGMEITPVIVFSNLGEEKDVLRAKELGANDFMIKSNFTLDELVEKIKSVIG